MVNKGITRLVEYTEETITVIHPNWNSDKVIQSFLQLSKENIRILIYLKIYLDRSSNHAEKLYANKLSQHFLDNVIFWKQIIFNIMHLGLYKSIFLKTDILMIVQQDSRWSIPVSTAISAPQLLLIIMHVNKIQNVWQNIISLGALSMMFIWHWLTLHLTLG